MIKLGKKTEERLDLPCLKCISLGRAYDLLREDIRDHLRMAQKDIGFRFCRFHALFHDDMDVVYRRPDGTVGYHWHQVDKIYDFLLSVGLKPFVELNPMPSLLASGTQEMFYYAMNVTPPKVMEEWYDLVYEFTRHITERYGEYEVEQWRFEIWNEPNLKCFWTGTQQDYFNLYENAARAVKAVNPNYLVGGPATAVGEWIGDIIEYCTEKDIPIDFVSTHLYPQDEYCVYKDREHSPSELGMYYIDGVRKVWETVKNSSRPDIDIYWTEFNTLATDCAENITFLNNIHVDKLFSAACIVRNMVETRAWSNGVAYWTISDVFEESQMRHTPFSGTYGLITLQGIPKAGYNAFKLMKKMRGKVFVTHVNAPLGCGVLACEENDIIRVLLWNCQPPEITSRPDWSDTLAFDNINAEDYIAEKALIREGQGSAYEAWLEMGKPANLTAFEEDYLRARSEMEYSLPCFAGTPASIDFTLKGNEVCYFEIHKRTRDVAHIVENKKMEAQLNTDNT